MRLAGNDILGAPIVNAPPESVNDEMVVGAFAVKTAVPPVDWETTVGATVTLLPPSAGVGDPRRPKPKRVESFVPT